MGLVVDPYRFAAAGGGATPSFVGATSGAASSGTGNVTVTPHASTTTGDFICVFIFTDGTGGTFDEPAGWTRVQEIGNVDGYFIYRNHDGSSTYTFTRSVSTQSYSYIAATFADADYDTHTTTTNFGGLVIPSVTPSVEALILLGWGTSTADDASSPPAGFTEITDTGSGGMATEYGYSDATYPASPTGAFTPATPFAGNRTYRTITVALKGA